MSQESLDGRKEDANGASGTLAEIDTEGFLARIFQGIDELEDEFANSSANISSNSWEHIHSNELILTAGDSQTVEQFLKVASSARNFQVIVTETGSSFSGHQAALRLAEHGIDTIVISDSAVFAIMPEISKVILSSHAVTANGGVTAVSGSRIITAAANFFSTPVVFLTGLHKISPISPHNTVGFSYFRSPENVYSFSDENIDTTKILDPTFDYIPPGHVSLFITNVGIFPPSSIQQLVKDTYGI